jgi:hypothetical protein
MNNFFQKKPLYIGLSEFFIVSTLILFFCSDRIAGTISILSQKPEWLDQWFFCHRLENQITRILGLNPGGIWEGGLFYPFHKLSILFDEPTWGISLLVTPLWLFTKNIFLIFRLSGIVALFLSWILTYYLVKSLGSNKICAFYASAMFCLSSISLSLIMLHIAFWAFFLLPLLGLITLKIFSTSRIYWGILGGILFGYLAWCSMHLFLMGGLFLFLFILWKLGFDNHSNKTLLSLLTAFIISGIIAGAVLVPMCITYQRFDSGRGYQAPFLYASNWVSLIYRNWPDIPFNPITKTHIWEYFKTNAKGEINLGISILLFVAAMSIFIIRLKESVPMHKVNKFSKYALGAAIIIAILFALLNIHFIAVASMKWERVLPRLATGITYLYYILAGAVIYILRNRIKVAIKHLDFFLLFCALLSGLLAFGPYYLTANKSVIAAPTAFLQYHILGFSGIQATARWGLLLSFMLSIGVALFLSRYSISRRFRTFTLIFMLISLFEVMPGFLMPDFRDLSIYRWTPRETDIFLKNLPGKGAVLELESFPVKIEQHINSDNSLGYVLFSRLYHKRPLVTGYASFIPHAMKHIFCCQDAKLSLKTIEMLRKFGAKYWVFHIDGWPKEEVRLLKDSVGALKQIVELDGGKTLIYEDPDPKPSVGYADII